MSPTVDPLQCGIVGAGIAGLAAALALHRARHEVDIFEKSSFKHEIGAAISLTPNANLILDTWGFDAKSYGETDKLQVRNVDPATLERTGRNDFAEVRKTFGHNFNAFHRVDLHKGLMDLAMSPDQPGKVPNLHLGNEIVDIDCQTGLIKVKDGTGVRKDLIVVADGWKSRFVEVVTGTEVPVLRNGKSIYRTLIPMHCLMSDPFVHQSLFENEASGQLSSISTETGVLWICYPCRNDEVMNFALFHTTKEDQQNNDDWNSPASVQDAIDQLRKGTWHPVWEAFAGHAEDMSCYTLGVRDVLPKMVRNRMLLIGDSAHPMMPTVVQGGSMALEDAAALETFFSPTRFNSTIDSVERRLALWNEFRLPRNCVTQLFSNATLFGQSIKQTLEKVRTYYSGPLPPSACTGFPEHVRNFWYRYDVFAEAEKAVQCKDAEGGIPEGVIEHFGLKAGPDTINE